MQAWFPSIIIINNILFVFTSRVVYRYSLLNQTDAERYDSEFEKAMAATSGTVYHDSEDDEVSHHTTLNDIANTMNKNSSNKEIIATKIL